MKTPDIHPCTCGSRDAAPVLDHRDDGLWHSRVECPDCEAAGPERTSTDPEIGERVAVEEWNEQRSRRRWGRNNAA